MSVTGQFEDWWSSHADPATPLPEVDHGLPVPAEEQFQWVPDNDGTDWGEWSITVLGRTARGYEANRATAERKAYFFCRKARTLEINDMTEFL